VSQPAGLRPQADGSSPPSRSAADALARRALALAVAGAVVSVLFFPAGAVLDVLAVITGARALRSAGREGRPTPGRAVIAVVVGGFASLLCFAVLMLVILFGRQQLDYRECMSGANTQIDQDRCRATLEHDVRQRVEDWFGITL
jgi:hypothetical protein